MGVWIDGQSNIAIEQRRLQDEEQGVQNYIAFSESPVRCGSVV